MPLRQYQPIHLKFVTQPSFKQGDKMSPEKDSKKDPIPPEKELLVAIRQNKLDPSYVNEATGETLFYQLVALKYDTAISFISVKPKLCEKVINIPCNGKTPLDIAEDEKMVNMLEARGAKHYKDLTEEEKAKGISKASIQEPSISDAKNSAIIEFPKEDARVAVARLHAENAIKTETLNPNDYSRLNDTPAKKRVALLWKQVKFSNLPTSKKEDFLYRAYRENPKEYVEGISSGAVDTDTGKTIYQALVEAGMTVFTGSLEKEIADYKKQNSLDISEKEEVMVEETQQQKNTPNGNYFDAFNFVDDETPSTQPQASTEGEGKQLIQSLERSNLPTGSVGNAVNKQPDYEEVSTGDKPAVEKKRKEIKIPDSYKQYPIMTLKNSDPYSMDDIIGLENIKREIIENVISPLNKQDVNVTLKANNVDIPNGILLASVADAVSVVKATASETGMPILQIMDLEMLKPMMKDIEKNYKDTGVKTIILIQGLDKFFNEQNSALAERNFRLLMNKCGEKGALLIATTDDKEYVCKSFKKSGLLDKILEVKKPTIEDRKTYILHYFGDKYLFSDLNNDNIVNELAELTDGFNYVDIDRVLDESARTAVSNSNDKVSREVILEELKEFTAERGMTPVDKNNITGQCDTVMKRVPVTDNEPKSLDELSGMTTIKEMLRDLYIEPIAKYDLLKSKLTNPTLSDGAMFYGPPGNGKTLTAKTFARELGIPFYETKLSDIATSYRDEELKNFQARADQLIKKYKETGEMSVWFLDEFDSIGTSRDGGGGDNSDKKLVDTMLQIIKNPVETGIILIVATNNPADIDPALKRGGRIGNWIYFPNPNFEERVELIKRTLAVDELTKDLSEDQEYDNKLAEEFEGSSNSDIVVVLNNAKRMSIVKGMDFKDTMKTALERHIERKMAEFCNKVGLEEHKYSANAFTTLDELGGLEDVKQALQEYIIDVWNPEVIKIYKENKIDLPGGVMLEGPPGTGKTTIIETLARQMGIPLYKMNYSKMHDSGIIHSVSRHVEEIFEKLKLMSKISKKPVMLFFDEAEKFFPITAREKHEIEEVNTYKELMNTASENGIILVGATNHKDMVNQEIIGNTRRMGKVIHVGNPDDDSRQNLFEKIRDTKPILTAALTGAAITELVTLTKGLSIGDITDTLLKKLYPQAIHKKQKITESMVIEAFKKVAV